MLPCIRHSSRICRRVDLIVYSCFKDLNNLTIIRILPCQIILDPLTHFGSKIYTPLRPFHGRGFAIGLAIG